MSVHQELWSVLTRCLILHRLLQLFKIPDNPKEDPDDPESAADEDPDGIHLCFVLQHRYRNSNKNYL